jgi:hypothetical protein
MNGRSARQSFLGQESDAIFARSAVAVIGCCGGGSHVAQQLAHIGFRRIRLFDADYVEDPNRNRMVGSQPSDVADGRLKVHVLRDLIMRIAPDAEVEVYPCAWQDRHLYVRDCSIVFGCLDGFGARDELEGYCRRFLLPYIDVGMDVHELLAGKFSISGQIITSLPGGPCMRCMGFITEARIAREAERYGAAGNRPQVIWPNGVLASTAVGIAVQLLTPWHSAEIAPLVEYDGNRHLLRPSAVVAALAGRRCPHYPLDHVGDPFWLSTPAMNDSTG